MYCVDLVDGVVAAGLVSYLKDSAEQHTSNGHLFPPRKHLWTDYTRLGRVRLPAGYTHDGGHVRLYQQDYGEVLPHRDRALGTGTHSCVVFLNSDYEGAHLVVAGREIPVRTGAGVVFCKTALHHAGLLESGTKCIAVFDCVATSPATDGTL